MAKNLMNLSLRTVPNGYILTVDGTECMYFNEVELTAGFIAHVGMKETSNLEKGSILSMLFSAMMGQAYADNITTLKMRVGKLSAQYAETIDAMDKSIDFVNQSEKTISGFMKRIEELEQMIKGTESEYRVNKELVDKMANKVKIISSRLEKSEEALGNDENEKKTNDDADTKEDKKKRKKKDEAILKAIEKKAKNNPNIK